MFEKEVASLAEQYAAHLVTLDPLIRVLASDIQILTEEQHDEVEDLLDDAAAELKSDFGARLANAAGGDAAQQILAINAAESWVSSEVCNGTPADRIGAVLWVKGSFAGAQELLDIVRPKR